MNAPAVNQDEISPEKAGTVPIDVDYWLREFDEEHGPQYDDLAHFGLSDADQRAHRLTKQLFDEFGE